jgi:hypothetical protein
LIESYLPASSIVYLSYTSQEIYMRWTQLRWKHTFSLHRKSRDRSWIRKNSSGGELCSKDRWEMYHKDHFEGWEKSFLGSTDHSEIGNKMFRRETQFNVNSLVPSIREAYGDIWGLIELSFIGLHDMSQNLGDGMFRTSRHSEHKLLNLFTTGFTTTSNIARALLNPFLQLLSSSSGLRAVKCAHPRAIAKTIWYNHAKRMGAWKLACLLQENGVDCFECHLCDSVDVKHKTAVAAALENGSWMTPCRCKRFVHRRCLEEKLGLKQKLYALEFIKSLGKNARNGDFPYDSTGRHHLGPSRLLQRQEIAPQIWLSYDLTSIRATNQTEGNGKPSPIKVNNFNQFISPNAKCGRCGEIYERSIRLPRSITEVVFCSLSDPLALERALSTLCYFVIIMFFIALGEDRGYSTDGQDAFISVFNISLSWPHRTWKGVALAWWQLQQSCMLHILYSRRFATVVSQLWIQSTFSFYIKLYFYFVITSLVLTVTYFPPAFRFLHQFIGIRIFTESTLEKISPLWDYIAIGTLLHYAMSSTAVIAIFWRTNYRIYTVSNKAKTDESERQEGRIPNWNRHPIYHGHWHREN